MQAQIAQRKEEMEKLNRKIEKRQAIQSKVLVAK